MFSIGTCVAAGALLLLGGTGCGTDVDTSDQATKDAEIGTIWAETFWGISDDADRGTLCLAYELNTREAVVEMIESTGRTTGRAQALYTIFEAEC